MPYDLLREVEGVLPTGLFSAHPNRSWESIVIFLDA